MAGMQFINNFRGIAILMVLLSHSIAVFERDTLSPSFKILEVFLENCTVIFVVLAGYFFYLLLSSYTYRAFLKNKFMYVICPYLFISIPAILIYVLNIKTTHYWIDMEWFRSLSYIKKSLYLTVTGAHVGPLWFVPMVAILYLVSPLFAFANKLKLLPCLFALALPIAMYFGRPEFNENVFQSVAFFLPAYVLGMLLARHKILYTKIAPYCIWLLPALMAGMMYYADVFLENSSIDLVAKLVLTIVSMGFIYTKLNFKITTLDLFARLSFYLFFIHGYFTGLARFAFRYWEVESVGPITVLAAFAYIIISSIAAYLVLKLLLGSKSKNLIGA